MKFINVIVRQQAEGKPGFMEDKFEVDINVGEITLFNKSEEEKGITFVRMSCGATLCVAMTIAKFRALLKKVSK